jgi:FkbM family methyltransferase
VSSGEVDPTAIARDLAATDAGRLVLVDVGAAGGVPRRWRPLEERLLIVGFEPDERGHAALEPTPERIWLNTALWERSTTVDLHLTRKAENSSVLVPNREFIDRFPNRERFDVVGSARVEATTLDDALGAVPVARPDFLKLDVQGAELAVLRGARSTLSAGVFGVELEVAFAPLYEGQPLFGEVDQFLGEAGFELIDLRRVYWKSDRYADTWGSKGQLVAGDALYLRNPATFTALLEGSAPEEARTAIVNALVTCALYGFLNLGLELLDDASSAGLLDRQETDRARVRLEPIIRFGVERLPSRMRPRAARLSGAIRRGADGVAERARRFAPTGGWPPSRKRRGITGDGELGNR